MSTINDTFAKAADASGHEHGADGKFASTSGKEYTTSTKGEKTHVKNENGESVGYTRPAKSKKYRDGGHHAFVDTGYKNAKGKSAHSTIGVYRDHDQALNEIALRHENRVNMGSWGKK